MPTASRSARSRRADPVRVGHRPAQDRLAKASDVRTIARVMLRRTLCPIIVGREDEISAFEQALRSASARDGRVVLVAGDAGIGKTRLVSELAQRASADGLPVLRGGCSETDLQVPYLPFVE